MFYLITKLHSLTFTHEITKMPGERQGILNVSLVSTLLQVVFSTINIFNDFLHEHFEKRNQPQQKSVRRRRGRGDWREDKGPELLQQR